MGACFLSDNGCSEVDTHLLLEAVGHPFEHLFSYFTSHHTVKFNMLMHLLDAIIAFTADIEIFTLPTVISHIFYGVNLAYITFVAKKCVLLVVIYTLVLFLLIFVT